MSKINYHSKQMFAALIASDIYALLIVVFCSFLWRATQGVFLGEAAMFIILSACIIILQQRRNRRLGYLMVPFAIISCYTIFSYWSFWYAGWILTVSSFPLLTIICLPLIVVILTPLYVLIKLAIEDLSVNRRTISR